MPMTPETLIDPNKYLMTPERAREIREGYLKADTADRIRMHRSFMCDEVHAGAVYDAYIAQSDTLWMNQGQIEHLRGRVKEQAKVMQELVACANEMADALKEHHEACLDVGSDTYGHEYSGSYSEEQSRCALLDYGRYKKAGAL